MENNIIIDKTMYKIMKYIYRKQGASFGRITKKFGEDDAMLIVELCRIHYTAIRLPDKKITQSVSYLSDDCVIHLLPPGNKYVEDMRESSVISRTPIFLSVVSVIVSVVALLVSIFSNNNEIFVHLLK